MYRQDAAPDNSILVTAFNSQLFGVDRATGEIRWSVVKELGDDLYEIAIEGDVIIVASKERLGFVDYLTGKVHAIVPIEGHWVRRPTMVVDGGFVYISRDGDLTCFTTHGQRVWQQPFKGLGNGPMTIGVPGNIRQADDAGTR